MLLKRILILLTVIFSTIIMSGCDINSTDDNKNLSHNIIVEQSGVIPVLDGKATRTGIYIRNTTDHAITGVKYELASTSENQIEIAGSTCQSIEANTSCLLPITTPNLASGEAGSSILVAHYAGKQSQQLINYRYFYSKDYDGVNFSDGSQDLTGPLDYATVYAFVGASKSIKGIRFYRSNDSLAISNGLTNDKVDILENQVVPLEIQSNKNITSTSIILTPYLLKSGDKVDFLSKNNTYLQVMVTPSQQANLLMSNLPILKQDNSPARLVIMNNGTQVATNIHLVSGSSDVSVTPSSNSPCIGSLQPGMLCNYDVTLNNNYDNGSVSIALNYDNAIGAVSATQTAYYQNQNAAPMVYITPSQTNFSEQTNSSQSVWFNVRNIGSVPLESAAVAIKTMLSHTALAVQNTTCAGSLVSDTSCQVQVNIASSNLIDDGVVYLKMSGIFTAGAKTTNYSFASLPIYANIIDTVAPTVTSTDPQNTATGVNVSTAITVNFSEPMTSTTLNSDNIKLQRISDNTYVSLTLASVSPNNQTVTFTQSVSQMSDMTDYRIVVNPSQLIDAHGNPMDPSSTSQVVSTFTTGDFTAPSVINFNPGSGTPGANITTLTPAINIMFSESMNAATLTTSNIILKTQSGAVVSGYTINYDSTNNLATINLNGNLLVNSTTYEVYLNQPNITDLAGNSLGANSNYKLNWFTPVIDVTSPTVSSVLPTNGSTAATVTPISITFSESMMLSTLTSTNIQLLRKSNSSYVTLGSPSVTDGNTVTFQPSSSLGIGESYSIVVNPSAITDLAGNSLNVNSYSNCTPSSCVISTFVTAQQSLAFSPTNIGNNPGNTINIQINANIAENVTVTLPAGMTVTGTGASSFTCYANLSCSSDVNISSSTAAGYYTISAVGLLSGVTTSQLIPVAVVKQFIYATNTSRRVELCNFESTGISACSIISVSGVTSSNTYGVVVSADGLYAYLMTGANNSSSADGIYKCNINQSTKIFDGCVKQASTGTNSIRSGVFSSNGKFFYYNAMNVASIMRCNVDSSGNLSACAAAKSGLTNYVERLTMNFNGTNIFVNTGSGNLSCSLDNSTGALTSCVSSGGASSTGLSFNLKNTKMYLIGGSSILQYDYNPITQLLSSGTTAYSSGGYAIGFSPNYVYTGNRSGLYQCNIDNNTGIISNCILAPNGVLSDTIEGITVFN